MESSSIVSFNNDLTFQSATKGDNVSVHELALHAMRDRCLLLQRRINTLETDNMRLKMEITKASKFPPTYIPLQEDEKFQLHQKIAELSKQKSHLMHHVFMVTCENKSLWSKISHSKREQIKADAKHAPLLRTSTYIHSTPRQSDACQEKFSEASLEEISLKLINSYIQEKSQLVEQYEQMTQLQDVSDDILNVDSIGFRYIEEPATDSLKEIYNYTQKLIQLKKELSQQEEDLKVIISRVETLMKDGYKCESCVGKVGKTISSEHKEIETSDSLVNFATPVDSTTYKDNYGEVHTHKHALSESFNHNPAVVRICPMCGQSFTNDIQFSEFQAHVENHFTGESEPDSIIDNYELGNSVNNVI